RLYSQCNSPVVGPCSVANAGAPGLDFETWEAPSVLRTRTGVGKNGSRNFLHATGPEPGPPPPWGVENVLCRFRCITSTPKSPGRVLPTKAFIFAPSM